MAIRPKPDNPLRIKPKALEELAHLRAALKWCRDFGTAIDGGANMGAWANLMATRFKRVHAFEPDPDNFLKMAENIGHLDGIQMHEAALGEKAGTSLLAGKSSTSRHLARGRAKDYADKKRGVVPVIRLDDMKLDHVGLIKLDLEGYELWALRGAKETIERCAPVIIIEVVPRYERRFGGPGHGAITFLTDNISISYTEVETLWPNHILVPPGFKKEGGE